MIASNTTRRFFVDTNVLLYSIDAKNVSKRIAACTWIERLWFSGTGTVSWQVLNEFYVAGKRKLGWPDELLRRDLETLVLWKPVPNSLPLLRRAWYWMDRAQVTYWDGLILGAAELSGCRYLLSEDFQAGRQYGPVTVINPFATTPADLGVDVVTH